MNVCTYYIMKDTCCQWRTVPSCCGYSTTSRGTTDGPVQARAHTDHRLDVHSKPSISVRDQCLSMAQGADFAQFASYTRYYNGAMAINSPFLYRCPNDTVKTVGPGHSVKAIPEDMERSQIGHLLV